MRLNLLACFSHVGLWEDVDFPQAVIHLGRLVYDTVFDPAMHGLGRDPELLGGILYGSMFFAFDGDHLEGPYPRYPPEGPYLPYANEVPYPCQDISGIFCFLGRLASHGGCWRTPRVCFEPRTGCAVGPRFAFTPVSTPHNDRMNASVVTVRRDAESLNAG